jgi:hypothetical protein
VYLDEKHIASMAEHSLINHYRFESCPDYKKKFQGLELKEKEKGLYDSQVAIMVKSRW